jgi:hypothetical protein
MPRLRRLLTALPALLRRRRTASWSSGCARRSAAARCRRYTLRRVLTAHIAPSLAQMRTGEAPLEVTCRVTTKWRDGEFYPVRIIEKRKRDPSRGGGALTGGASDFEYYVHYEQCAAPARLHAARVRADPA